MEPRSDEPREQNADRIAAVLPKNVRELIAEIGPLDLNHWPVRGVIEGALREKGFNIVPVMVGGKSGWSWWYGPLILDFSNSHIQITNYTDALADACEMAWPEEQSDE